MILTELEGTRTFVVLTRVEPMSVVPVVQWLCLTEELGTIEKEIEGLGIRFLGVVVVVEVLVVLEDDWIALSVEFTGNWAPVDLDSGDAPDVTSMI